MLPTMRHLGILLVLLHLAASQWLGWHVAWGHAPDEPIANHAHHDHGPHPDHRHPQGGDDEHCTWCQLAALTPQTVDLPADPPAAVGSQLGTPPVPTIATTLVGDHVAVPQRARAPPQAGPSTT